MPHDPRLVPAQEFAEEAAGAFGFDGRSTCDLEQLRRCEDLMVGWVFRGTGIGAPGVGIGALGWMRVVGAHFVVCVEVCVC